jgi:hypothetical protein
MQLTRLSTRMMRMVIAVVVALGFAVGVSASPAQAVGCAGEPTRNGPGYAYMINGQYLESGPYAVCTNRQYAGKGVKVYLHCYHYNDYKSKWWHVRIAETDYVGWLYNNNLDVYESWDKHLECVPQV